MPSMGIAAGELFDGAKKEQNAQATAEI
jgi:hypothetical protein